MKKLMLKLRCLAALAAGMTAFGASAGAFLDSLMTNEYKVASSPYAMGGDIILHLNGAGYDDWVHIFYDTTKTDSAFVPAADLTARVLVVGGGGSGGGNNTSSVSGGGGAGGLLYKNELRLGEFVSYAVTVGKGGAAKSGQGEGNSGTDSKFIGSDAIVSMIANGGGKGGGWGNGMSGGSGGSGGGAGGNASSAGSVGTGTSGQGHSGGISYASNGGGGGGGAGEPGKAPVTSGNSSEKRSGDGGDGLAFDITGWMQYYAGGGGGGGNKDNPSHGGLGGGGDGGVKNKSPSPSGEDGLGGGGGGAWNVSGKGGNGIVIVRYCQYSGAAPLVRPCTVEVTGGSIAEVTGALADCGNGSSAATVRIVCTPRNTEYPVKDYTLLDQTTATAVDVPFSVQLKGLKYDAVYDYEIIASNASTEQTVQTGSFTTYSKTLAPTVTCEDGGYEVITFDDTFEKVYIFNKDATLNLSGTGYGQLLVVAGGGGGGGLYGGGGGGGGLSYSGKALFLSGNYTITVGQGGAGTSGYSTTAKRGGNSSVVGGEISVSMTGGGGGGSWDRTCSEKDGGSGGGDGGCNSSLGAGVLGQGYDGGDAAQQGGGGGGGGARGAGGYGKSGQAGVGGAGFLCSITGEELDYAAGGGGGSGNQKGFKGYGGDAGGLSAGLGGSSDTYGGRNATSGLDGRGGGGGGGGETAGGDGGDGVVILRFTDYTLAGAEPIVKLEEIFDVAGNSAKLAINVSYAGDDDDVTLAYSWGYAADDLTLGSVEVPHYMGEQVFTVTGLSPNRTYHVKVTATNSAGAKSVIGSLTTPPKFSKALTCSSSGGTLGYTIDFAEDADHTDVETLTLFVNGVEQQAWTDDASLSAGAHVVNPFTTEQFGTDLSVFLRSVATDGVRVWTNDTATLNFTLNDAVTYKWNKDVADGDWKNPENWTSTGGMRGYPTVGSTADLTTTACATIHVDTAVSINQLTYQKANAEYVFVGEGDGAQIVPVARGTDGLASGQKITIDNLLVWFKYHTTINVKPGGALTVRNGGIAKITKEDNLTAYQAIQFGGNAKLVLATGGTVQCNGYNSSGDGNVVDFIVPMEGCAQAMLTTSTFPGSGVFTLNIPKKLSPLVNAGKQDVPLVSASGSIDVSQVVFGETVNSAGYFYFTDANGSATNALGQVYRTADAVGDATIKGIWYRHVSPGINVIIR